jgi:hypothetical protein
MSQKKYVKIGTYFCSSRGPKWVPKEVKNEELQLKKSVRYCGVRRDKFTY